MFPLMWFFMTHCLMLQRSRDDPNAWLFHEPQCSTRTSHYTYAMLSMLKPLFSGTLYANDLNIHGTVYCLRLNQKTHNYTHVRGA